MPTANPIPPQPIYMSFLRFPRIIYLAATLAVIASDITTKNLAHTAPHHITVTSFLDIVKVYNYGASFGIGSQYQQYANIALLIFAGLVCAFIFIQVLRQRPFAKNHTIALALITGGGIANIIDRIRLGAVFDFISLHYQDHYFPAFNLADAAITIGAILYLINSIRIK